MNQQEIEKKLIELFQNVVPSFQADQKVTGQLSSIEILEFVGLIEKEFSIEIHSVELNPSFLESTTAMAALIKGKLDGE